MSKIRVSYGYSAGNGGKGNKYTWYDAKLTVRRVNNNVSKFTVTLDNGSKLDVHGVEDGVINIGNLPEGHERTVLVRLGVDSGRVVAVYPVTGAFRVSPERVRIRQKVWGSSTTLVANVTFSILGRLTHDDTGEKLQPTAFAQVVGRVNVGRVKEDGTFFPYIRMEGDDIVCAPYCGIFDAIVNALFTIDSEIGEEVAPNIYVDQETQDKYGSWLGPTLRLLTTWMLLVAKGKIEVTVDAEKKAFVSFVKPSDADDTSNNNKESDADHDNDANNLPNLVGTSAPEAFL